MNIHMPDHSACSALLSAERRVKSQTDFRAQTKCIGVSDCHSNEYNSSTICLFSSGVRPSASILGCVSWWKVRRKDSVNANPRGPRLRSLYLTHAELVFCAVGGRARKLRTCNRTRRVTDWSDDLVHVNLAERAGLPQRRLQLPANPCIPAVGFPVLDHQFVRSPDGGRVPLDLAGD